MRLLQDLAVSLCGFAIGEEVDIVLNVLNTFNSILKKRVSSNILDRRFRRLFIIDFLETALTRFLRLYIKAQTVFIIRSNAP